MLIIIFILTPPNTKKKKKHSSCLLRVHRLTQKLVALLCTAKEQSEKEIKETIIFTKTLRQIYT